MHTSAYLFGGIYLTPRDLNMVWLQMGLSSPPSSSRGSSNTSYLRGIPLLNEDLVRHLCSTSEPMVPDGAPKQVYQSHCLSASSDVWATGDSHMLSRNPTSQFIERLWSKTIG